MAIVLDRLVELDDVLGLLGAQLLAILFTGRDGDPLLDLLERKGESKFLIIELPWVIVAKSLHSQQGLGRECAKVTSCVVLFAIMCRVLLVHLDVGADRDQARKDVGLLVPLEVEYVVALRLGFVGDHVPRLQVVDLCGGINGLDVGALQQYAFFILLHFVLLGALLLLALDGGLDLFGGREGGLNLRRGRFGGVGLHSTRLGGRYLLDSAGILAEHSHAILRVDRHLSCIHGPHVTRHLVGVKQGTILANHFGVVLELAS